MFHRDKNSTKNKQEDVNLGLDSPPIKPFTSKGNHTPTKAPNLPGGNLSMPTPVRHINVSSIPNRHNHLDHPHQSEADSKRLVVGKNIQLSGEIEECEHLVVEGKVEVTLNNARLLEVASKGIFKGSAQIDDAIISGQVDGDLTVNQKLTVLSSGRISGSVRYGSIIIEAGGEVSGDIKALDLPKKDNSPV